VNDNFATACFFIGFVLLLIATLVTGGVITAALPWLLPGGLCALALGFLWDHRSTWNRTP